MAEGGKGAKDVFREAVPKLIRTLGNDPPFTMVTAELNAKYLITDDELRAIKGKDDHKKGSELAEKLKEKIGDSDNPNACLLKICDIFESENVDNSTLKKHGESMRDSISNQSRQTLEVNEDHLQQTRRELIDQSRQTLEVNEDYPQQPMCQGVLEMEKEIENSEQLIQIATTLKRKYCVLRVAVKYSLISHEIHFECIKDLVELYLGYNNPELKNRINSLQNFDDLFNFLDNNSFIGYLNYNLLKQIWSYIPQDDSLKTKVNDFEEKYAELLQNVYCKELVKLWPELSSNAPTGLPCISFRLDPPWLFSRLLTWIKTFGKFSWSHYAFLTQLRENCIIVTYSIPLSVIDEVMRDLRNPVILEQLAHMRISVELPQEKESEMAVDVIKLNKAAQNAINKCALLNELPMDHVKEFAYAVYAQKFISKSVLDNPTIAEILSEFKVLLDSLNTVKEFEVSSTKFLQSMSSVGGRYHTVASALRHDLIKAVQKDCAYSFSISLTSFLSR